VWLETRLAVKKIISIYIYEEVLVLCSVTQQHHHPEQKYCSIAYVIVVVAVAVVLLF
jgi:hypothetical protein